MPAPQEYGGPSAALASAGAAWNVRRIETPRISVLIPAYNEEQLIAAVLDQVRASFAAVGESSYEVIVCDNHSTDGTADVARAHGAQVVCEPHNQIARARNTAARAAQGRWLIFLDADSLLLPDLLAATLGCLAGGQVCAGGAVLRFGDTGKPAFFASSLTNFWNWISARFGFAAGSYVFCARTAWEEVGGFDERVYAGEELLFSRRLNQWARAHKLRFQILTKTPVVTSARKLEWYGQWQLLWRMVLLLRPGALRDRQRCSLWYTRPPGEAVLK